VVVARELTKVHEEFVRGRASEVHAEFARREKIQGEIVVLLAPAEEKKETLEASPTTVLARYHELLAQGLSPKEARGELSQVFGLSKRQIYRIILTAQEKEGENNESVHP
jgi:16S rRNA (cytidine1402-2'-O)-methyltransferase